MERPKFPPNEYHPEGLAFSRWQLAFIVAALAYGVVGSIVACILAHR